MKQNRVGNKRDKTRTEANKERKLVLRRMRTNYSQKKHSKMENARKRN